MKLIHIYEPLLTEYIMSNIIYVSCFYSFSPSNPVHIKFNCPYLFTRLLLPIILNLVGFPSSYGIFGGKTT